MQAEACACTDRVDVVCSSFHFASSASDGRYELRVGLRVVSEDDAAQLQNVLNKLASTGSQARMTVRR